MKGEYRHTIDTKGRVLLPSKLRLELGERFVATKGLDGCLFLYPQAEWDKLEEKIKALPFSKSRDLQRFFFSSATDLETDSQGRVLLPANLRTYADLQKEVMVLGVSSRVELWNPAKWDAYSGNITTETIAQAMEEIGF